MRFQAIFKSNREKFICVSKTVFIKSCLLISNWREHAAIYSDLVLCDLCYTAAPPLRLFRLELDPLGAAYYAEVISGFPVITDCLLITGNLMG